MRFFNLFLALLLSLSVRAAEPAASKPQAEPAVSAPEHDQPDQELLPGPYDSSIARLSARILVRSHYLQEELDDQKASQFLDQYLDVLDPQHMLFLQSDLQEFDPFREMLDDLTLKTGNTMPAYIIFKRFLERFHEQVDYVNTMLETNHFTFTGNGRYTFNRRKAPRPKDIEQAKQLWRDRLRYEYLQEELATVSLSNTNKTEKKADASSAPDSGDKTNSIAKAAAKKDTPESIIRRRYARILRTIEEYDSDDVLELYLTSLTHVYDPHSDYMGRATFENFEIGMKLSLFGIGALLQSEDGYCKIKELTPGGPAQNSKKLKSGDRIVEVAQGTNDPVDVVDMKLSKVVDLIRGDKGTEVRLTIIPADASDPSARKVVALVRDKIKLEDKEAKAQIIEYPDKTRVGVIDLPSFYSEIPTSDKQQNLKSTTEDVARLIEKLEQENVSGIVLDLRRNGGGSLEEAINLTGLFIKEGPVVQVRDPDNQVYVDRDTDPAEQYKGPLIVLTSRFSASASEILAGALQDYGRALIVGDSSTHGKGTVQQLLRLGPLIHVTNELGALKLTIRKFYRASGSSTQLRGVVPDIVLPSINNYAEVGETSLDHPLPWDTIDSTDYDKMNLIQPYLPELKKRSTQRVAEDPDFIWLKGEIERYKETINEKSVSMNEAQRLKEKREAVARAKAREKELKARPAPAYKVYDISLKQAQEPGLPEPEKGTAAVNSVPHSAVPISTSAEEDDEDSVPQVDITMDETRRILLDLISLTKGAPVLAEKSAKEAVN